MTNAERRSKRNNPNRKPRLSTVSVAVNIDTVRQMRLQAAQHDMSLSNYIYSILKIVTRNFSMLNLYDIENNLKKKDENDT